MARERRPDIYRRRWSALPAPLVPRHLRFDVPERTLADGTVEQALDEDDVAQLAAELDERGIEAVADLLHAHSFANADNERAAARRDPRARRRACDVAISSDVSARDPRVRAHADHGRERLRPGARRRATSPTSRAPRVDRDPARPPAGDALQRRRRDPARRAPRAPDPDARVRARPPARSRPRSSARLNGSGGPDVVRHGRHHRQALHDRGRPPAGHPRLRGRARRPLHARLRASRSRRRRST